MASKKWRSPKPMKRARPATGGLFLNPMFDPTNPYLCRGCTNFFQPADIADYLKWNLIFTERLLKGDHGLEVKRIVPIHEDYLVEVAVSEPQPSIVEFRLQEKVVKQLAQLEEQVYNEVLRDMVEQMTSHINADIRSMMRTGRTIVMPRRKPDNEA